jgi:hypothetical protein
MGRQRGSPELTSCHRLPCVTFLVCALRVHGIARARQLKGKITKRAIDAMQPRDTLADDEVRGFVARCLRWDCTGRSPRLRRASSPNAQRGGGRRSRSDTERRVKRAQAAAASDSTVNALLDAFLDRHVRKSLHTAREVERIFNRYVRERIGTMSIYALRRHDVVEMLDAIEDKNGPVMADRVLAWVRKAFNWQAIRDDTFVPPIVRGMARTRSSERSRERILADDEIRAVWTALDRARVPRPYPALVRVLLLMGQRLEEVASMRWEEIDGDGVWTVPASRRIKGGANTLPLTAEVLQVLGVKRKKGVVFTTNGHNVVFGLLEGQGGARCHDRGRAQGRQERRTTSLGPARSQADGA